VECAEVTRKEMEVDPIQTGNEMYRLIERLYPICRSITGNGVRETLRIIGEQIGLEMREVPSGTRVFDWIVPREWNIRDAYIKNSEGQRVIDFSRSNLHVLNYSVPVRRRMSLAELKPHLFTLRNRPEWIPYMTSYYKEQWGFCLTLRQFEQLPEDEYEVVIDSTLEDGSLTFGEYYLRGSSEDEILISSYVCHPSLCDDNLSGVALTAFLAKQLTGLKLDYSYRFLFIPETIGAIAWLSLNEKTVHRIRHGLVATCVGDPGKLTYKRSRRGDARIDRAVEKVLSDSGEPYEILDFFPYGSDERQFCSPGFNLAVGSLMRTPYGRFPEYHTSADDLNFVRAECLGDSLAKYLAVLYVLENDRVYLNVNPKCEPHLSRHGLYKTLGGHRGEWTDELALLWTLNLSDGSHSLLDISVRSGLKFELIHEAAGALVRSGLLRD
jgi:aminopeptidase-like protein